MFLFPKENGSILVIEIKIAFRKMYTFIFYLCRQYIYFSFCELVCCFQSDNERVHIQMQQETYKGTNETTSEEDKVR